jgi:hypothetical protein
MGGTSDGAAGRPASRFRWGLVAVLAILLAGGASAGSRNAGSGEVLDCQALVASAQASPTPSYPPGAETPAGWQRVWWTDSVGRGLPRWVYAPEGHDYIVTVRQDAPDPGLVADELARTHGLVVTYVYRAVLGGFAAFIPPCALPGIKADPRVADVVADTAKFVLD